MRRRVGVVGTSRKKVGILKRLAFSFSVAYLKMAGAPGRNVVPCNTDCWCGEKKVLKTLSFYPNERGRNCLEAVLKRVA